MTLSYLELLVHGQLHKRFNQITVDEIVRGFEATRAVKGAPQGVGESAHPRNGSLKRMLQDGQPRLQRRETDIANKKSVVYTNI